MGFLKVQCLVGVSHEIGRGAQGDSCGATEVRSPWTWRGGEIETTTIISMSPKTIQILDPSDYSAVDLEMNEEFSDYNIGDEIRLIKIENYIYLIK